jgi:hypothetical protein
VLDSTPNYGSAKAGQSYAKFGSNWRWSESITRGAQNELVGDEEENLEDEIIFGEETDSNKEPWEVTINLDGNISGNTAELTWDINLPGALGGLEIFASENKTKLGTKITHLPNTAQNYLVRNLKPNTTYYFVLTSTYNDTDLESNQLKLTTQSSGVSTNVIGETTEGYPKQIIITELLPNPESGREEYIELFNPTNQAVDITGWKIEDASGKSYILNVLGLTIQANDDNRIILAPGQYLMLAYSATKIRLNNTGGEDVVLLDGDGNIIDQVTYEATAKVGLAYVLAPNEEWFWTEELTPGEENDITFAGVLGDSTTYLTNTGANKNIIMIYWLLATFLGIISYYYAKQYLYKKL